MWIINCILLIVGTVAAVCGISFYFRNREASGNIRFYILSYGISSAIWCLFFGVIGFCDDFEACNILRKFGDIGVVLFLITETFLVTEISGAKRSTARLFKGLAIVTGLVDYLFFAQDDLDLFVREGGWTTWNPNPAGALNRAVHSGYCVFTFVVLLSFGIVWLKNNKVKRLRRFLYIVFAANFNIVFFSTPDTFLPAVGRTAVPTSGIGAAVCAIVIWYGATRLGAFDIRTGNIKDRLFDFLEAGVIVLNVDQRIVMMNRYSKNIAETRENALNQIEDFFDITHDQAKEMFRSSMTEIYMARLWNKEKTKAYSVRLSAIKDNFGEVFCFLCVFVDVTEEVEAVSRFEIASRAKSRFLAQMSHEIRTPINAVLGMNEMILRESEDKDILEYAQNIDSAGNTLLTLINSILDFSKIEDGKMELVPVKYDTASFINDLYNSIIQRADAKGLAFILEVDETLPCALIGDDVRFSQVIMNLLTNAVKYTEKGSVTLSLHVTEKGSEKVKIHVSVKDTGIGIREEDRERLFESFERLDEVRNHNIEGTGLGISIVTSLLDMMGSRLIVDSAYGEGSVFSFTIEQEVSDSTSIGNYEKRLRESSAHKDKDDLINAPCARILVVDDNGMNLKVARNLLKLCGIRPDEAASGKEAIELMRQNTYEIVFLDHMMPGMDGIETLHRLQKDHLVPENTVMIALTANAVVGARENYLAEGFNDYLSKPIEIKHLVEKLKAYLPGSAYRKTAGENGKESGEAKDPGKRAGAADSGVEEVMEFAPDEGCGRVESAREKGDMTTESGLDEESGIMEFAPDQESEIMEYAPENEDGGMEYDPANEEGITESSPAVYDTDSLKAGGIDVSVGLNYCADDLELYFEMLGDYAASCEEKTRALEELFIKGDWQEYEILVHALKSNAKMIGAMPLSELAKALEEAAGNNDAGYMAEHHGSLVKAAKDVADVISKASKPA